MPIKNAKKRITEAVSSWGGVTLAPHRFGGTAFMLGKRELGHIHGDRLIDIPFPKPVRDELVTTGQAEPHHILPDSGWISLFLRTEVDVDRAIKLMRRSFDLAAAKKSPSPKE
jgi:predicted DNA-binding protein (MmcQ/YjbR family)